MGAQALLRGDGRVAVLEPGVLQGLVRTGPLVGVCNQQVTQEVQAALVGLRHALAQAGALWVQILISVLRTHQPPQWLEIAPYFEWVNALEDLRGDVEIGGRPHSKHHACTRHVLPAREPWHLREIRVQACS